LHIVQFGTEYRLFQGGTPDPLPFLDFFSAAIFSSIWVRAFATPTKYFWLLGVGLWWWVYSPGKSLTHFQGTRLF